MVQNHIENQNLQKNGKKGNLLWTAEETKEKQPTKYNQTQKKSQPECLGEPGGSKQWHERFQMEGQL